MKPAQEAFAPNKSIQPIRTEAHDADEHAQNLTDWQQQYDQVSGGGFYGSIAELALPQLQVFKEHTSHALRQTCNVWSDSIWLGLPENGHNVSRINGLEIKDEHVMCRPGDTEFELITPEDFNIFGVVITQSALMKVADIQGVPLNWQDLTQQGRLAVPRKTLYHIRYILNRILNTEHNLTPDKVLTEMVMMSILEVLKQESHHIPVAPSFERRRAVVDKVKHYMEAHPDAPVTITDLCEHANVSRRTLQYSFTSVLGISPLQYIRASRLNGVRRALHQNQFKPMSNRESISDIASQWGFWHLSQFAKDYKQLFGERPSETLHR
ncbi:helix-turn-helix domain-containing protein [Litoribrevibacter euphylliae]|uniref:Helix-turn-helix domain-containing protein n=1 Tax=Litoribrevibacter euphylliae TaxID=1834034 RepID=A0ABV7HFG4_9GAMM